MSVIYDKCPHLAVHVFPSFPMFIFIAIMNQGPLGHGQNGPKPQIVQKQFITTRQCLVIVRDLKILYALEIGLSIYLKYKKCQNEEVPAYDYYEHVSQTKMR